ncbi:MAG: response regulator transcription factor [Planctomycetes bacterium]|nr:response regulator transcription factor [Planctomycetota bacterium]
MATPGCTIFVVDDDPSVSKLLTHLVTPAGMEVVAFSSAQAFLDYKPQDGLSCLVLDVEMPKLNGLELQDELRRVGRDIPIIFLTGRGDVPMTARAMKAGAVDFLEKPCQPQNLLDAIDRALALDHRTRVDRAECAAIQLRVETLTPRELEVLNLVVAGLLNKQIATRLGLTEGTVKVHRGRVMTKMQAESVAELTLLAARIGIQPPGRALAPTQDKIGSDNDVTPSFRLPKPS